MNKKRYIFEPGQLVGAAYFIEEIEPTYERRAVFKCLCGEHFIAIIWNVTRGITKSCGCARRKHGHTIGARCKTKISSEYNTWRNMIERCTNPSYKLYVNYGGRGISVCERWLDSFENFITDMGKKPTPDYSIERINNNGNYEPSNCKWESKVNQARNKRSNVFLTHKGETLCMAAWAQRACISTQLFWHRINTCKWSIEKAIDTPVRKSKI